MTGCRTVSRPAVDTTAVASFASDWHRHGGVQWPALRLRFAIGSTLATLVAALAVGCGSGSGPTPPAASNEPAKAEPAQAQEEEKPNASPAQAAAAPAKRRRWKIVQPNAKEGTAADETTASAPAAPPPSRSDFSKWEVADLNAALIRKDVMFVPGVMVFSARQPTDTHRASDLDALVRRVGKMKDDPTIVLALPSGASNTGAAAAGAASPGATSAAAASGKPGQPQLPAFKIGIGRKENGK